MPKFGHLANLSAYAYDRGSKIVGMIEERLGETAFLDFMRTVYQKYHYRILRVADFQRELEAYSGRSWDDFFRHWLYGTGMCDWSVAGVTLDDQTTSSRLRPFCLMPRGERRHGEAIRLPVKAVVTLKQRGGMNEPTVLGFRFGDGTDYQVRIPIMPDVPMLELEDSKAKIECLVTPSPKAAARARRRSASKSCCRPSRRRFRWTPIAFCSTATQRITTGSRSSGCG